MTSKSYNLLRLSLLLLVLLAGAAPAHAQTAGGPKGAPSAEGASAETVRLSNTRFFKEVHAKSFPGTYQALARLSYNGDFVLLVETDSERNPISDTLLVWVQHHSAAQPLAKQADWADLIVTCYPELLSGAALERHVLPGARGRVWIYFIDGQHLIVSDQRHPALKFALKKDLF